MEKKMLDGFKKFLVIIAYIVSEFVKANTGIPFNWETVAPIITYLIGQSAVDLRKNGTETPSKIEKMLPLILAATVFGGLAAAGKI